MGNAGEHIDYALLLDGLKAEREQGITIDVAYRYFSTNNRKFIIADTPGHEQYTRNMITGGSTANLGNYSGRRPYGSHYPDTPPYFPGFFVGYQACSAWLSIRWTWWDFSEERFNEIVAEYKKFVAPLGDSRCDLYSTVRTRMETMWWISRNELRGMKDFPCSTFWKQSISTAIITLVISAFPVQYVLRPNLDFRGFCGKVASGIIRKGDKVMALPSGKVSHVKSIVTYDGELDYAFPPQSVTLTLEDEIRRLTRGNAGASG